MNYYLLTIGIKNLGFSMVLHNHTVINFNEEIRRREIIDKFNEIDNVGIEISDKKSNLKIKKFRKNYLIKIITINKDEKGRFAPVELLLMNYERNNELVTEFIKINDILESEDIILDKKVWMRIPEIIDNSLKLFNKKKRNKIILVVILAMIILITIIKFIIT